MPARWPGMRETFVVAYSLLRKTARRDRILLDLRVIDTISQPGALRELNQSVSDFNVRGNDVVAEPARAGFDIRREVEVVERGQCGALRLADPQLRHCPYPRRNAPFTADLVHFQCPVESAYALD